MKTIELGKLKVFLPKENANDTKYTAHIIVRYNNNHCGGVDPYIKTLVMNQQKSYDYKPVLIIVSRDNKVVEDYEKWGVAYIDCTGCKNNYETVKELSLLNTILNLQLIHTHGYSTNYFWTLLKMINGSKFSKIPTVVTCHGWVDYNLKKKWLTFLDLLTYRGAKELITVSDAALNKLTSFRKIFKFHGKANRIHNGLSLENNEFTQNDILKFKCKYNIKDKDNLVVYVGRLDTEKRPDRFVDVANKLIKKKQNIKFLFVGSGALDCAMKRKVQELKISDNVIFAGEIFPPYIAYASADLLYLPSDTEGIPMCVLECMNFGTPVIASDVGGVSEVITQGFNGFIFRKDNVLAIAKCIEKIITDKDFIKKLGENAKVTASEKFSGERMYRETMKVYNRALGIY